MKIRTDFVTNSSSSSFILAKKPGLNKEQIDAIIQVVEKELLGKEVLNPESTEDEIERYFDEVYVDDEYQEEIRKALAEGKSIYSGYVIFEEEGEQLAALHKKIWDVLEENGEVVQIDTDLYY